MQEKRRSQRKQATSRAVRRRLRIREDLESLGVSPKLSEPVAERLEALGPEFGTDAYARALEGVAVAWDVCRKDREDLDLHARDVDEIRRLMEGFAEELQKLEEGLRMVSAYVLRMHRKATRERGGLLH